jgi:DNA-3-methyladenine glycosylase
MVLPSSYYLHRDVVFIAKDLLGKTLSTKFNGKETAGIITETEAYAGIGDKASHAYGGRRTKRTETMYSEGGVSYVYLCYGIHHLFNIVTNKKDVPEAVLIRAIWPTRGISEILKRRKAEKLRPDICVGPGKVSIALGINKLHDKESLTGKKIWLEDTGLKTDEKDIIVGPRIGVDYAGKDALLPYRFRTEIFYKKEN